MLLAAGGEGDPAWADPPTRHRRAERPLPRRARRRYVDLLPARARPRDCVLAVPGRRHLAARLGDRRDRRGALRHDGRPERHVPLRFRLGVRGGRTLDRVRSHASQRACGRPAGRRDPHPRPGARDPGGAGMTVVRSVTPISVRYPEPNDSGAIRHLTLCRIEADDGTVGWGEAVTSWPDVCRATEAMIDGIGTRARRRPRPARQRRYLEELQAARVVVRQPRRHLVVRALRDRHRPLGSQGQAARRSAHAAPRRGTPRAPGRDREHPSEQREPGGTRPIVTPGTSPSSGSRAASSGSARRAMRGSARTSSGTWSSCASCASVSARSRC